MLGESPRRCRSTATPSGPELSVSGESTLYSHSRLPVARESVYTFAEVLEVDHAVLDDRSGSQRAIRSDALCRLAGDLERPVLGQVGDVR